MIRKNAFELVDLNEVDKNRALVYSTQGMGNGEIETIADVVYVDITAFDRTQTRKIAEELGAINEQLTTEGREYILIGPGRWGTRDPFTGVPVVWSQISGARVIVEMGLEDFPLDASLGSHFFHNVTSMNIGYFSVPYNVSQSFVNLERLKKIPVITQTHYIRHIRFREPLKVQMDGRQQKALILI